MKTHKYTLIILFLLCASSYTGLAQTPVSLKPSLPDEELIRLRANLVEALGYDNIEKAKEIYDSLMSAQAKDLLYQSFKEKYLTYKEQYLTLFLLGSYDNILENYQSGYPFRNDTTRFQRIDLELIHIARAREKKILDDLRKNYNDFEWLSLHGLFSTLTNSALSAKESLDAQRQRLFSTRINYAPSDYLDLSATKQKSESKKTNLGVGVGLQYQMTFFTGELSKYLTSHQIPIYPFLSLDAWYKRFFIQYFVGIFGKVKAKTTIINGDVFEGPFYGNSETMSFSVGYEMAHNKSLSIIPNIGIGFNSYLIFTESTKKQNHIGNWIQNHYLDFYTAGLIVDYKFSKRADLYGEYYTIRLKYDYGFPTELDVNNINGAFHAFTIGIFANYRDFKRKKSLQTL